MVKKKVTTQYPTHGTATPKDDAGCGAGTKIDWLQQKTTSINKLMANGVSHLWKTLAKPETIVILYQSVSIIVQPDGDNDLTISIYHNSK